MNALKEARACGAGGAGAGRCVCELGKDKWTPHSVMGNK